jgi:nicotinamide-nucleotide amidase
LALGDDLTREGICALLGETPVVDPDLEAALRAWFARRGANAMPEQNVKQAWLIPSARPLLNPRGTAPGWWVEKDGRVIVSMPGVPPEMEYMWSNEVRPELERRSDAEILVTRTIKTLGLGESTVDSMAKHLYGTPGIGIGTYARGDGVHLRIGARPPPAKIMASCPWSRSSNGLRRRHLGRTRHPRATSRPLRGEAATSPRWNPAGGLLANTLTDVSGAADYFKGGIVTYWTDFRSAVCPRNHRVQGRLAKTAIAAFTTREAGHRLRDRAWRGPAGRRSRASPTLASPGRAPKGSMTININQMRRRRRRAVTTTMLLLRRTLLSQPS